MTFNIAKFKAELNSNGIARTALYEVAVFPPSSINTRRALQSLSMRAESASLLGRSVTSAESKIYGPVHKIAVDSSFGDLSVTFLLSDDMYEYELFQLWQDMTVGKYRTEEANSATRYDLGYYKDYVGSVTFTNYSETGKATYKTTYTEAYPLTVGDIEHAYATNEPSRVNVTFAFHELKRDQVPNQSRTGPNNRKSQVNQQTVPQPPNRQSPPDNPSNGINRNGEIVL